MKKTLLLICIIFCITLSIKAQNLISNPSFEDFSQTCNSLNFDIFIAGKFNLVDSTTCLLKDWISITNSPDVFTLNSSYFKLPTTEWYSKYNYPHQGNNIIGGVQFNLADTSYHLPLEREIFENQLIKPLIKGHIYKLSYYVQLFDSMPNFNSGNIVGINSFSAYFSDSTIPHFTNGLFPYNLYKPQIQINQMIIDTQHWVLLTDTFTAKGGERYMCIGNLQLDTFVNYQSVQNFTNGIVNVSYYFYDDFSLIDLTPDGVEEQLAVNGNQLIVYPNPCAEQLTVSSDQLLVNTLEVTNLLGRACIIPPYKGVRGMFELDVSSLSSGIYFIKATDEKGNTKVGKFVKQ